MEVTTAYILDLEEKLKTVLHSKRYVHTLGVAYLSASLAMCHGVSHRDALVAGLLHDCAKNIPEGELWERCVRHKVELSEYEKRLPQLWHTAYGAYLAKEEYGITQPDIIAAVRNHTIGRPGMSELEQIIFLADYLEPERTQPTDPPLDELRRIAFEDLDQATCLVGKNTLRYLESTGQEIDPLTYEVFYYYEAKVMNR